jgi:hypothetical protein
VYFELDTIIFKEFSFFIKKKWHDNNGGSMQKSVIELSSPNEGGYDRGQLRAFVCHVPYTFNLLPIY